MAMAAATEAAATEAVVVALDTMVAVITKCVTSTALATVTLTAGWPRTATDPGSSRCPARRIHTFHRKASLRSRDGVASLIQGRPASRHVG